MIDHDSLTHLVLNHFALPVNFAGHRFLLDGDGVLFWPAQDLLVFSDLHFEKGSFLTQFAHPLPRYDTQETIKRMAQCIEKYQASKVICLGDSFHDANAIKRMQVSAVEELNRLVDQVMLWRWVLGNHDPEIPTNIMGERCACIKEDNLLFVHEKEDEANYPDCAQIIGHYHPKVSANVARHKITGSCFVVADSLLILPAFGKFTGGLNVKDKAIHALVSKQSPKYYLKYNKKIFLV